MVNVTEQHTMQAVQSVKKLNLWDHIAAFNFKGAMEHIKTIQINWMEFGTWTGAGIICGVLFRRYFATFVMILFLGILIVGSLDYTGVAPINWNQVHTLLGMQPTPEAMNNVVQQVVAWVKLNAAIVGYFGLGFVVGFKLS